MYHVALWICGAGGAWGYISVIRSIRMIAQAKQLSAVAEVAKAGLEAEVFAGTTGENA